MRKVKAFKIEEELWTKFRAICILKHTTPEIELSKYIKGVVDNDKSIS